MLRHQSPAIEPESKTNPRDRRSGVAAVEMAVVSPVLFLIILGIFEFGHGIMVANLITNAARDGARTAVVDGSTDGEVTARVQDFLKNALGLAKGEMTVVTQVNDSDINVSAAKQGDKVTVTVTVPHQHVQLFLGRWLAGRSLQATVSMRHE